jgi:hypothetical protein
VTAEAVVLSTVSLYLDTILIPNGYRVKLILKGHATFLKTAFTCRFYVFFKEIDDVFL